MPSRPKRLRRASPLTFNLITRRSTCVYDLPWMYQVNVDVLSWLLRPVPFVAGLPAPRTPNPTSTPPTSSTENDHVDSSDAHAASGREARDVAVLSDADAVGERRAVPVPEPKIIRAGRGGADEGKDGTRNRAGFHSYDETHQVIGKFSGSGDGFAVA